MDDITAYGKAAESWKGVEPDSLSSNSDPPPTVCAFQPGIPEKISGESDFKWRLKVGMEWTMLIFEWAAWKAGQQVQRPWGWNMSDTFKELSQQTEQGRGAVASSLAENLEALELKQFSPFFGGQQC